MPADYNTIGERTDDVTADKLFPGDQIHAPDSSGIRVITKVRWNYAHPHDHLPESYEITTELVREPADPAPVDRRIFKLWHSRQEFISRRYRNWQTYLTPAAAAALPDWLASHQQPVIETYDQPIIRKHCYEVTAVAPATGATVKVQLPYASVIAVLNRADSGYMPGRRSPVVV